MSTIITFINSYVRMPPALVVLGAMYAVYAAFYIVYCLIDGYWRGFLNEILDIIRKRYKVFIIGLILSLIFIVLLDKPITEFCKTYYNQQVYIILDFICSMAEGWFVGGIIIILSLIFQLYNNKFALIVSKISLMSALYAGVFNAVLKFIFNRERPSVGFDPWHFFHFFVTGGKNPENLFYAYNSMPSGHTITVVAALTPLFLVSKNWNFKLLIGLLVVLVAFSRIYTINHWFSDAVISSILGITIGIACYKSNNYRIKKVI